MPIFEYYCPDCRRRVSVFFRSIAGIGDAACPECAGTRIERRFSRVVVRRGGARNQERAAAFSPQGSMGDAAAVFGDVEAGGLGEAGLGDDPDPRELAHWARRLSTELGEPMDAELDSALADLGRGADPDEILGRFDERRGQE